MTPPEGSVYRVGVYEYGGDLVSKPIIVHTNLEGFVRGLVMGLEARVDPDRYYVVAEEDK